MSPARRSQLKRPCSPWNAAAVRQTWHAERAAARARLGSKQGCHALAEQARALLPI